MNARSLFRQAKCTFMQICCDVPLLLSIATWKAWAWMSPRILTLRTTS